MALGDSDLDAFLQDASSCTFGNTSFKGWLDAPENDANIQSLTGVVSTDYKLTYKSADAALVKGSAVTVDGVSFTVHDSLAIDDGKFSKATLKK
jgi:hypothetical protein